MYTLAVANQNLQVAGHSLGISQSRRGYDQKHLTMLHTDKSQNLGLRQAHCSILQPDVQQ